MYIKTFQINLNIPKRYLQIILYTYNWSKDNVDKLTEHGKNVGLWLSVRANLLNSITTQKLGLFYNQAISRKSIVRQTFSIIFINC